MIGKMVSSELLVTSWKLKKVRVQIHQSLVQINELRVQLYELYEFKSICYEIKSTIYEFKSTCSRIIESCTKYGIILNYREYLRFYLIKIKSVLAKFLSQK